MTVKEALELLNKDEKTLFSLNHAMGVMYYDGATVAPKASYEVRGNSLGELSRIYYEISTSKERDEALKTLTSSLADLDEVTRKKVENLNLDYLHMSRIPVDEYVAWQELITKADAVWHEAKEKNDYALFEPYLQQIFDTVRKFALYMEPDKDQYETFLDSFERGLTKETCDKFFETLRAKLVPLIKKVVVNRDKVNDEPLHREFPIEIQRQFSDFVMGVMGIDKSRCIIGETEHPFTTSFSKYDVRITTHYHSDLLASSLYSVIHESGHALYELNVDDKLTFGSLGGGVSMAIHESQSRFYENIIGRSREFVSIIYPWLKEHFKPLLDDVNEEQLYKMLNKAEPSLIRTEADELTYSLHIMIRYELEKRMFMGELTAKELPKEWNRLYKEYLNVEVPDDRNGILQDSHWSNGNIGYFPSYAIGSAYGAQFLSEMGKDFDVFGEVKKGDFTKINDWFRERIWKFGSLIDPTPLFKSVCREFDPNYFVDYLTKKFTDIYGL